MPPAMATDNRPNPSQHAGIEHTGPRRPTEHLLDTQSTTNAIPNLPGETAPGARRRRNHRGGAKKKKNRRQSFATSGGDGAGSVDASRSNHDLLDPQASTARPPFYRLGQSGGRNLSDASLDSEALLDHRSESDGVFMYESRS